MHKFKRIQRPSALLSPLDSGDAADWDAYMRDYPAQHHELAKVMWLEMQDGFCAYCDRVIDFVDGEVFADGHIEHRERIRDNPNRINDWDNLFFSCNDCCSCGRYKDMKDGAGSFKIEDVIDPASEDPARYFKYDADGGIIPMESDPSHPQKASETIRVFNLDKAPALTAIRRQIAITVQGFIEACNGFPTEADCNEFFLLVSSSDCPSVYEYWLER